MTRTLSLKDLRYPITFIIIKRSVTINYISVINYYTFIVPKRNEILEIKDDIITNPIDEDLVKEYFSDFEKLLEKYNYINLYKKCMNESQ